MQRLDSRVGGLIRPSAQLDGRLDPASFLLPVEEESHSGNRRHDRQGGRQVLDQGQPRSSARRDSRGNDTSRAGSGLPTAEQFTDAPWPIRGVKRIQEAFVVRKVKAFVEHSLFEMPIDLGKKNQRPESSASFRARIPSAELDHCSRSRRRHVRSKTSLSTSIAMSHRTPSQCDAIIPSVVRMASRVSGLK